jgi:hypothetical protein
MGIVGIAARRANADAPRSAEAYARTALALADGFISSWDEKFRSGTVRPETVINSYVDRSWTPLLQTPPFPEYTSGHSVISTAAATVLTDQFGPNFAFADSTSSTTGSGAHLPSFEAAAAEAAISRLYGGIPSAAPSSRAPCRGGAWASWSWRACAPRAEPLVAARPARGETLRDARRARRRDAAASR